MGGEGEGGGERGRRGEVWEERGRYGRGRGGEEREGGMTTTRPPCSGSMSSPTSGGLPPAKILNIFSTQSIKPPTAHALNHTPAQNFSTCGKLRKNNNQKCLTNSCQFAIIKI